MDDQTNGTSPQAPRPLRAEIFEVIDNVNLMTSDEVTDAIMAKLMDTGHYMPGTPPAAQILRDAEQFAGQFTLALLCVRLLRMLNSRIITPETKGMERWLNDYIEGRNHGPVGKPMLWPQALKGLSAQLRTWGFQPTPTKPPFVARVLPNPTIN